MVEIAGSRRRPVMVIGLLLLLQAAGLAAVAGLGLYRVQWQALQADPTRGGELAAERAIEVAALFVVPAAFLFLGALGSFFAFRWGWLLAEFGEATCLGACLFLYSAWTPVYVYPMMAYCVLLVLFLNSRDVRMMFMARGASRRPRTRSGRGREAPA